MFLFNLGVIAVFSFLAALATNYTELVIYRLLMGFGIGADYAPAITLLTELSPKNERGKYHHYYFVSIAFGLLLAAMIGFAIGPLGSFQWRALSPARGYFPPHWHSLEVEDVPEWSKIPDHQEQDRRTKNSIDSHRAGPEGLPSCTRRRPDWR